MTRQSLSKMGSRSIKVRTPRGFESIKGSFLLQPVVITFREDRSDPTTAMNLRESDHASHLLLKGFRERAVCAYKHTLKIEDAFTHPVQLRCRPPALSVMFRSQAGEVDEPATPRYLFV